MFFLVFIYRYNLRFETEFYILVNGLRNVFCRYFFKLLRDFATNLDKISTKCYIKTKKEVWRTSFFKVANISPVNCVSRIYVEN